MKEGGREDDTFQETEVEDGTARFQPFLGSKPINPDPPLKKSLCRPTETSRPIVKPLVTSRIFRERRKTLCIPLPAADEEKNLPNQLFDEISREEERFVWNAC